MPPSDPDRPQRVTLPTLQILAAFMADLKRDDWYGRALSVHTVLGSGTVLQCLYRLENWGWLESRWEDREVATRDGRPPRRAAAGVRSQDNQQYPSTSLPLRPEVGPSSPPP